MTARERKYNASPMGNQQYGEDVQQAAKTLHLEGLNSREIRERLAAGIAGLPYKVEPGERTIGLWRKRWKRAGEKAGWMVRAGGEEAAEEAIYRRLLGTYRETLQRLDESIGEGKPDAGMLAAVERMQRIVDGARYRRRMGSKKSTPAEEGGELTESGPGAMVKQLIEAESADRETRSP